MAITIRTVGVTSKGKKYGYTQKLKEKKAAAWKKVIKAANEKAEREKEEKKSKLGKKLQKRIKKIPISPSKFLIGKRMTVRLSRRVD